MEGANTRQRALTVALDLFSRNGYHATSMSDIAQALDIKAPSLYKHFKGKEELYAALLPLIDDHYQALWDQTAQRHSQLEQALRGTLLSADQLEQETLAWFESELTSPEARAMGRFMAVGTAEAGQRLDRWLWERPLALYEGLFERLIGQEILRRGDPHVMAVEYLAPLERFLAAHRRGSGEDGALLEEARRHIRQFHRVFARREQQPQSPARLFRR